MFLNLKDNYFVIYSGVQIFTKQTYFRVTRFYKLINPLGWLLARYNLLIPGMLRLDYNFLIYEYKDIYHGLSFHSLLCPQDESQWHVLDPHQCSDHVLRPFLKQYLPYEAEVKNSRLFCIAESQSENQRGFLDQAEPQADSF